MKVTILRILLSTMFLYNIHLQAREFDIDAQIEQIRKESDIEKRVYLMNQLKRHLSQMNETQREEAIMRLRTQSSQNVTHQINKQEEVLHTKKEFLEKNEPHLKQPIKNEQTPRSNPTEVLGEQKQWINH